MSYIYDNFLKPISQGDRNLQILDSTGIIVHTVNPFSIIETSVSNSLIKINLKSQKTITLDFYNPLQTQQALISLQTQIDTLIQNVPFVISKDLENYIDDQISDVNIINTSTASSTINYNYNLGNIWYHNDISSNYIANFYNVPETDRIVDIKIIISQGATAYMPTIFKVNSVTSSVSWLDSATPSATASKTNVFEFSIINYITPNIEILGKINIYG